METMFESEVNLLFIDPSIPNYNSLIFSVKPGFEVVVLDTSQAGIDQISEVLLQKNNIESIHIISHGNTQGFKLGSTDLTSSNLNEYKDDLTQWAESLTSEADILVYGCDLGQDQDLMSQLAQFTGADIAASDDLTGSSALGGDWAFEVTTGLIESELAFQADLLESYDGIFHEGHFHNDPVVPNDPNFTNELVLSGLVDPISMEWLPDGRALILSKLGTVYIADLEASVPTFSTYMTLPDINTASEKGLIDIALDPDFETNNHFYLYYTLGSNKQFQISRFEHQGNTGNLNSETVIWQDPTAAGPPDHYGGGLNFGPDGKLYLTLGDKGFSAPERAQNLSLFEGKVLRMNKDGTIPQDNPFVNTPGALPEIWAYGVRNPFRSDWDFESNRLYIGDVGFDTWEEVNRISLNSGGANLGWNLYEGTSNGAPGFTDPIFQYEHTADSGAAIIGGTVYRGTMFPSEFQGAYFYADFVRNAMYYLKFDTNGNVIDADPATSAVNSFNFEVDGPVKRPVFIEQGPEGALYYLNLSRPGGQLGEVRRITYNDPDSGNSPPVINEQSTTAVVDNGLTVDFTGVATDANGDSLTYTWSFGDSTQATGASVSHTYATNGQYTPQLVVSDGQLEDRYTLPPIALGTPPTANIILRKQDGTLFEEGVDLFKAGDTILFEAQATDPDGSLIESSYNWDVQFIHDEHTHPEVNDFQGSSGTFNVTTTEHGFSADFQVGFEFLLTVTDSEGLTATDSFSIFPKKVDIGFNDNLPGNFNFTLDGFSRISTDANPFDVDTAVNFQHGVTAPASIQAGNVQYVFENWSLGALVVGTTPVLTLSAPETSQTYIANYIIDDPNPDPEPPVAGNDSVEVLAGSQNNLLNVLTNDSDPDPGDTINITGLGSNNAAAITTANGSTVSINGAGDRLIYTPGNGFTGNETFTYTIEDSTGRTSTANISATVSAVSGPPVTNGLVLHLDGDNGVTTSGIDLVTGWTDQSGLGNHLTGVGDPSIVVDGLSGHNVISLDGDGDQLQRLSNLNGLPSGNANRSVFMVAKYDSVGTGGFTYGKKFTNQVFGLAAKNDGDLVVQAWGKADADSNVDGTGQGWLTQSAILNTSNLKHYKDGTLIDSRTHTYNTFLERIVLGAEIDGSPVVDMDVAEILVFDRALSETERQQVENYLQEKYFDTPPGGGNQAPNAVNDSFAAAEDSNNNSLNVLANDTDADGNPLTITGVGSPTNGGTVTVSPGNTSLVYTPAPNFAGTETFTYTVGDGNGGTDTATVTLNVNNLNDAPNGVNDVFNVALNSSSTVLNVLANDTDPDSGDSLTITAVGTPNQDGIVSINPNNNLVYTPAVGFTGSETFTYTLQDAAGTIATATVTVNVADSASLPVTNGLVLHLDGDNGVTTSGIDLVTGWTDQSGLGNHLTGVGDPSIVVDGLSGHNVISLDGDGDQLQRLSNLNGLPSGNANRSVFMVAKYDSVGTGGFTYGKKFTNQVFGLAAKSDGDLVVQAWGKADADSNVDGTGQGWLTQSAILNTSNLKHYKDGTLIDSRTHTYNTFLERIVLGAEIDGSPVVDMDVAEILVFDRALSETERQQVENYLQQKYLGGI